jgi:hypothetical protein
MKETLIKTANPSVTNPTNFDHRSLLHFVLIDLSFANAPQQD